MSKTSVDSASAPRNTQWRHAGGKLREEGAETLTDADLLSILIGSGSGGKSAEQIANEILMRFSSFRGMANQPFEKLTRIKGLGEVKVTRIAACFEIARRIVHQVIKDYDEMIKHDIPLPKEFD